MRSTWLTFLKLNLVVAAQKKSCEEKYLFKSTYPPPADGPCVLFLCKSGCSANEPVAQAGRGPLQGICYFTKCKVLKESAARLHSSAWGGQRQGSAGMPGFIGRKILKPLIYRFFKIVSGQTDAGFRWGNLSEARLQALYYLACRPIHHFHRIARLIARFEDHAPDCFPR